MATIPTTELSSSTHHTHLGTTFPFLHTVEDRGCRLVKALDLIIELLGRSVESLIFQPQTSSIKLSDQRVALFRCVDVSVVYDTAMLLDEYLNTIIQFQTILLRQININEA